MVNVGCVAESARQHLGDRLATLGCSERHDQLALALADVELEERAAPGLGSDGLLPEAERISGRRRFGPEAVRRLGVIEVAKQAGFSLGEVRALLDSIDGGAPAHEELQALAARKLPEVEALIERARAMRDWLEIASACDCESLEACGLFDAGSEPQA